MLKGVKHHQSQLPREGKAEGWGSRGNTRQRTAQKGTRIGGNSYSHAQWYHTAYRTETIARRNKRHQEATLQAG